MTTKYTLTEAEVIQIIYLGNYNKAIERIEQDIERLEKRLANMDTYDMERIKGMYFPFSECKDGVWDPTAGCHISDAQDAAEIMADKLNKTIKFNFNGIIHTVNPRITK
jgi:hypothetical protein